MIPLALVLLCAFLLRIYGINWDLNGHLHPDERMLIMVAGKIHFFKNLNPDFFNYGTLPIYLLSGVYQIITFLIPVDQSRYDGMLLVGRSLSVFADLFVIIVIYKVARRLAHDPNVALFSSAVYAIMFFPIQNTHFFIVDTFLNLFLLTSAYRTLIYLGHPSKKNVIYIGVAFAAAAATKITAVLFYPVFIAAMIFSHRRTIKIHLLHLVLFHKVFLVSHVIFMPFAYIHSQQFIKDVLYQSRMNSDAYVFPYTLQYVGTLPYWYYIKNIALWGVGPVLFTAALAGAVVYIRDLKRRHSSGRLLPHSAVLPLFFIAGYALYFVVIGRSAVKFMRYMLPLYPLFAIFAGYLFSKLVRSHNKISAIGIGILAIIWTSMFVNIYSQEHTRISATRWIAQNIPQGSSIAVEHWDDRLPLIMAERYVIRDLALYETPDNDTKWALINGILDTSEYMIIASNRLSTPLRTLRDCTKYKKCYPRTAAYYDALMSGTHRYKKVAEFSVYPHITIGNFSLTTPDQSADESFTVYDHPNIMIFKRL